MLEVGSGRGGGASWIEQVTRSADDDRRRPRPPRCAEHPRTHGDGLRFVQGDALSCRSPPSRSTWSSTSSRRTATRRWRRSSPKCTACCARRPLRLGRPTRAPRTSRPLGRADRRAGWCPCARTTSPPRSSRRCGWTTRASRAGAGLDPAAVPARPQTVRRHRGQRHVRPVRLRSAPLPQRPAAPGGHSPRLTRYRSQTVPPANRRSSSRSSRRDVIGQGPPCRRR